MIRTRSLPVVLLLTVAAGCAPSTPVTPATTQASSSTTTSTNEPATSTTPSEAAPTPASANTASPSAPTSTPPDAASSAAPTTITAKNNPEFAKLLTLTQQNDPRIAAFATKYQGQNIEFDASICALAPHGSYKTRFDILICPGNYDPNHSTGPNFQFNDVNITADLNLTGNNIPDTLKIGQNIHVIATVDDFNQTQELFHLNPVETRIR